jgi:hypothetical protein
MTPLAVSHKYLKINTNFVINACASYYLIDVIGKLQNFTAIWNGKGTIVPLRAHVVHHLNHNCNLTWNINIDILFGSCLSVAHTLLRAPREPSYHFDTIKCWRQNTL